MDVDWRHTITNENNDVIKCDVSNRRNTVHLKVV